MFGNVKYEAGLLFNKENFKLVKKVLKRDEKIAKHNHENEEIIAICRKNNITIIDLMAKVNRQKAEMKKEKTNENQFEKE